MNDAPPAGWTREGQALTRTVERHDFVDALGYLAAVGQLAEAANHHPDVDLRYNKVRLSLSTHSAGHLTEKDFQLARQINELGPAEIESNVLEMRRLIS